MTDTVRTKAQLLSLFADNHVGAIAPQQGRDLIVSVYSFLQGNMPAWVDSGQPTFDEGNDSRFRIARNNFLFRGASYNDPKKAGSIVQIGDYPELTDGRGGYIGRNNASVFLTMNDLPSELGGNSYAQMHIRGQNSAALPYIWGLDIYVTNEAAAGATPLAYAAEFGLINKGQTGAGVAVLAATDRNAGSTYIRAAYDMAVAGSGGGWIYGMGVNGVITGGAGIRFYDTSGGTMAQGIDLSLRTHAYSEAAIKLGNADVIRWLNAAGSLGGGVKQDSSNNFIIQGGAANSIWFLDVNAARLPVSIDLAALATGSGTVAPTGLVINYDKGTLVTAQRVYVGATDSGGTGYRNLMVPN